MYIAIVYIDNNIILKGVKLLDYNDFSIKEYKECDLYDLIKNKEIYNLKLIGGRIEWLGGKERYPKITASGVDGENKLVVVGYSKNCKEIVYVVANYKGEIRVLSEEEFRDLEDAGYIFSNYNKKTGLKGLVRIPYECKCILKSGSLTVKLPFNIEDKLDIHLDTQEKVSKIYKIDVIPENLASKVEDIKFNINVSSLDISVFNKFKNLKRLKILSDIYVLGNDGEPLVNLESVYIKSVDKIHKAFKECKNLRVVEFGSAPRVIGYRTFDGCENLEIGTILRDGVRYIGSLAFRGCSKAISINLPESVMSIYPSSFDGCNNIKEFNIGNLVLIENEIEVKKSYKRLLKDSKNAVINCNVDYPKHYIKRYVADNVRINFTFNRGRELENKILKAKIIGLPIIYDDVANDKNSIKYSIKMVGYKDWGEVIRNIVLRLGDYGDTVLAGKSGFFIKLYIPRLILSGTIRKILLDDILIKIANDSIGLMSLDMRNAKIGGDIAKLGVYRVYNLKDVDSIDKKDDTLYINYDKGKSLQLSLSKIAWE